MSVHDVEGFVWKWQLVDIAFLEGDICDAEGSGEVTTCLEGGISGLDTGDMAGWDQGGDADGDAARAAADIEDFGGGLQVWEKVGGTILGGPPGVGAEDGRTVVGHVGLGCHIESCVFLDVDSCGLEE